MVGIPSPSVIVTLLLKLLLGSSLVRAGWSFDAAPRVSFPPDVARYRDRKFNKTVSYVGYNAYADATTRGQIRKAFEPGSSVVSNWDAMEGVLDQVFVDLGVDSEAGLERPVLMTEPLANLGYTKKTMTELLFECYTAPSVAYGIDSLFSYSYNNGKSGLVISSSHSSTHIIPVLGTKAIMSSVSRLNWGGSQSADYLSKLLRLKYPGFTGKVTDYQCEQMVREHCYVSKNFDQEMSQFLDWEGLEIRDHVIQYPFTEHLAIEKSEEELARIAERKRLGGVRLQEQAAKMRLEKLVQKEQELEYYKDLQQRLEGQTKKEIKRLLDEDEIKDEAQLDKIVKDMDKSIRKARNKDLGNPEPAAEEETVQTFPLLEIPDDQLDEAGIKQKRHQRLMKSGVEARARAKLEKEQERARLAEEERLDNERRENNLEAWLQDRRVQRATLLQKIKDRERQKADLGNRKSLASQMRMKTLANLASDTPGKKRRRGNDDDDFGKNDDDWGVYRTVQTGEASDDDDEEDLDANMKNIEAQLLKYDPIFTEDSTMAAQMDWTKSLMHAFLRGPRPHDPESQQEKNQIHLNVERIRLPEVIFQPSIAGIDQAGIVDIAADMINHGFSNAHDRDAMLKDVFLSGGNTLFAGFEDRLRSELRAVLPVESAIKLRYAQDPVLDAWKGAAQWAKQSAHKQHFVSRDEYLEKGTDYMKEHNQGNVNMI